MEVLGGPAWLDSEVYDIVAKGTNVATLNQAFDMLQTLLEDRCKLKVHKETREVPVYSLTVANRGPKMQPTQVGSCRALDIQNLKPTEPLAGESDLQPCGYTSTTPSGASITKTGVGVTMDQFAGGMLASLDRPVIDRTGLKGMFNIHLTYAPVTETPTQPSQDPAGPSIFTAVQQQLGLKLALRQTEGPVEVLVPIDRMEKPSAN